MLSLTIDFALNTFTLLRGTKTITGTFVLLGNEYGISPDDPLKGYESAYILRMFTEGIKLECKESVFLIP